MIDNITIKIRCTNTEFLAIVYRLGLIVHINSNKVQFNWQNLRFKYYPNSNILTISNSFHKYFNLVYNGKIQAPKNHNDFTLTDFYVVADYFSEYVLETALTDISISGLFEFGVNINSAPFPAFDLLNRLLSHCTTHVNEFYTSVPYRGKPCMKTAYLSDYRIKAYDKTLQAHIKDDSIFRYEIAVTEIRKLKEILLLSDISLADITTVSTWNKLFDFIVKTYDQIRKIPHLLDQTFTRSEIESIHGYCNALMRSDLQNNSSRDRFNQINNHNKIIYDIYNQSEANFFNILRGRIADKRDILINTNPDQLQSL